jgi:hypothetical protein
MKPDGRKRLIHLPVVRNVLLGLEAQRAMRSPVSTLTFLRAVPTASITVREEESVPSELARLTLHGACDATLEAAVVEMKSMHPGCDIRLHDTDGNPA